jgi:hypothetical protein
VFTQCKINWFLYLIIAENVYAIKYCQTGSAAGFQAACLAQTVPAQHSVHLTGGSLRVFRLFAWLQVDSARMALSRPAHQQVTQTVSPKSILRKVVYKT